MIKSIVFIGLFIALCLAIFLSPFASSLPDGLERVAEDKGFLGLSDIQPLIISPIPDYLCPGMKNERISTALAGIIGVILIYGLGHGLGKFLRKKNET